VAVEWTGLGPELLVRLDRDGREGLGAQLQWELRDAIRSGRLQPSERLPSSRGLAKALGVSRGLVLECYDQLIAEGYLTAHVGSATRVAPGAAQAIGRADTGGSSAASERPGWQTAIGPDAGPADGGEGERLGVDFRYGVPDLASFPLRDWLWALGEAGRAAPLAALGYGDPRGSVELRTVVASYLRRVRGGAADPELMVICSGFAQGINLVLDALVESGVERFAVEDPGDRGIDRVARAAGLTPVTVPIDDRGIDVEALSASSARGVILTPAHQVPTGVLLAPERRQQLVDWARRTDAVIVEDDYDAEFRYDRQPVGSLQGLAPDRVVGMGTVSKSLAPGLRLGWLACPPQLTAAIAEAKLRADRGSPALDQLALARLIESGRFDRHLRRMRSVYAARREALVVALARHAPAVRVSGLAAGFHAVAHLRPDADEQAIVAAARDRSVGLYGMSAYRVHSVATPPELVFSVGNLTESAIARGIATVADLLV
jgi:GntR family transcriptional regulator/MocR family aminotransferase